MSTLLDTAPAARYTDGMPPDPRPLIIATSRYQNAAGILASGLAPVGVTRGNPRFRLGYSLAGSLSTLGATGPLAKIDDEAEFTPLYRARLDRTGIGWVRENLALIAERAGAPGVVLLCYEDLSRPDLWCHRRILARWLEDHGMGPVDELAVPPKGGGSPALF